MRCFQPTARRCESFFGEVAHERPDTGAPSVRYAFDHGVPMTKAFAPAAERNRHAILEVLRSVMPRDGVVLEIASGSGQHASFFAERLTGLTWQPSDVSAAAIASIDAHVGESQLPNLRRAICLDARTATWPLMRANAVFCANMIHISPWDATVGLFRGAATLLAEGEFLITYGPYRFHGRHTAPSNAQFDASLRAQNLEWGVRDVDDLDDLAQLHGFRRAASVSMPANNWTLVWARAGRLAGPKKEQDEVGAE